MHRYFFSSFNFDYIYIYTFLLDSLIPSHWKEKVIWFFNGGRPGDKVFTGISKNNTDDRFSAEEVRIKYEELYQAMKDSDGKARKHIENRYWYKLYKKHESHMQIVSSQRDYLLCRDMVFMTLFLLFGYMLFQLFRNDIVSWKMILFFVVELIISWICACNKGKRYVLNVIALDLVDEKTETEPFGSR